MASSTRKAAMVLKKLDPGTAAELLRAAEPMVIKQIAAELAHMQVAGEQDEDSLEPAQEFFEFMKSNSAGESTFLKDMLKNIMGDLQAAELLQEIETKVQSRDPFLNIRSADTEDIAMALLNEPPQVAALVLGELSVAKSAELLSLVPESTQDEAVKCMATGDKVPSEVKMKVATSIEQRFQLQAGKTMSSGKKDEQFRKVSLLLTGLEPDHREKLLKIITEQDQETGNAVRRLMVVWEDVPHIDDRGMQQALRAIDSGKLALALYGAAKPIVEKVRGNISERARDMLDEEVSLLSKPKKKDIQAAREGFLEALREMHDKGDLDFTDR